MEFSFCSSSNSHWHNFPIKNKYCGNSQTANLIHFPTMYYTHIYTHKVKDLQMGWYVLLIFSSMWCTKTASNWKENNETRKALHYDEIFHIKWEREKEKEGIFSKQPNIKERLTNTETAISHKEFLIRVFPLHPYTLRHSLSHMGWGGFYFSFIFFCIFSCFLLVFNFPSHRTKENASTIVKSYYMRTIIIIPTHTQNIYLSR